MMKNPYYLTEVGYWDADGAAHDCVEDSDFPNRKEAIAAMKPGRNYLLYKAVLAQKATTSTHFEAYD